MQTYDLYKANPDSMPLETFGTCDAFPAEKCGQAGGPCGALGPAEAVACPSGRQTCPTSFYCANLLDSYPMAYSICIAVPPNCGVLG